MTRVAIVADSHFAERSRFEECRRLHTWIAEDILRRDPAVVLHAGDVYDGASTPLERQAVAEWLQDIANERPVVVVRGNHDRIHDLELLEKLTSGYTIWVEERPRVLHVEDLAIACLPWPRKAEILAAAEALGLDPSLVGLEALRGVLTGMAAELAQHDGPRILLAHAMVTGAVNGAGQPLCGCDLELGLADLCLAGADLVALGHIHQHQAWMHGATPVVYAGAPRHTDFGARQPVGYIIAEVERGSATWEFIEAPATPMVAIDAEWTDGGMRFDAPDEVGGLEIRFRYGVSSDQRDAARVSATKWADQFRAEGAVLVQVEEIVEADVRARAPEVVAARTTAAKLEALWASRGFDPGPRRESILGKLVQIEEVR